MSKQASLARDQLGDLVADPVARTQSGNVRGRTVEGIHVFKGVPFAAPPFGPNHLRPPQPPDTWEGVRDALEFGPKAPQASPPGFDVILGELVGPGEDCLTLNVWTSGLGSAAARPVMVWIAGGMFELHGTGAAACYDGSRFARDGVVCVTINYRVGAEGFLYLEGGVANLGLLDQIAALRWVQENIAAFGGNPASVTVFGQSAGAISVAALLTMPRAKGLFHRAIVESGSDPKVNSKATAERIGQQLAKVLGIEADWEAVAAASSDSILEAHSKLKADLVASPNPAFWGEVSLSYIMWAPVVDGDILPQHPLEAIRAGAAADIPLIIGSNTEETHLFLLFDGSMDHMSDENVAMLASAYGLPPEGLGDYRVAHPDASAGDMFSRLQTDWYWRIPAVRFADAYSKTTREAPTYMYEFAWRSPQMGGRLGAAHGLEMAFVFDTLGLGTEALLGPDPPQALADEMHGAWVAFAKTGDPGWPKYDASRRTTMQFDVPSRVVDDPMRDVLAIWEGRH
jgi:carboxylesterase type B